jgi:antirestriction protein ArdC
MSRQTARPHAGPDWQSLYDEITTKIISQLEAGCVPWVQPWGTAAAKAPLAMPKNAATGRCYSGINVLILWGSIVEHGFPVQSWVTFRQALGLGGNVRKGEHGTTVVYADRFTPDDEKRRAQETGQKAQSIPFLKRFTVFNVAQCDGLPDDFTTAAPPAEWAGLWRASWRSSQGHLWRSSPPARRFRSAPCTSLFAVSPGAGGSSCVESRTCADERNGSDHRKP